MILAITDVCFYGSWYAEGTDTGNNEITQDRKPLLNPSDITSNFLSATISLLLEKRVKLKGCKGKSPQQGYRQQYCHGMRKTENRTFKKLKKDKTFEVHEILHQKVQWLYPLS